ncbi:MAG: translation elongation factor Ts [Silvibacterium sp.]
MSSHAHRPQEFPSSGAVATYLHAGGKIGVLVEVSCETDFAASTAAFRQLIHDLAIQIAAASPRFIRREHVSAEILEREKDIFRSQLASIGKPPQVVTKILEGKTSKFYEEVCLYEQPFVKDQVVSISQLIAAQSNELGEEIAVRRFVRFRLGDSDAITAEDSDWWPEGGDEAGVTANRPKGPKSGSGFAAVMPGAESE